MKVSVKYKFIRFEIEQRTYAPNAIVGIYLVNGDERTKFVTAVATGLGKKLGDQMAIDIKECLENKYLSAIIEQ